MTAQSNSLKQKTGRRKAADIESPRDKTVCFMLSEEEKAAVDARGICNRLTRSALLAKITLLYLQSTDETRSQRDQEISERELIEFVGASRRAVKDTPAWQKQISKKTKTKTKKKRND